MKDYNKIIKWVELSDLVEYSYLDTTQTQHTNPLTPLINTL